MLDVHAPHEATHTWTDFAIHIATICVGLLIAIGLEQSVEALHHARQLHELREDLRQEDEKALRDNAGVLQHDAARVAWLDQRIALVKDAIRKGKPVPYIPLKTTSMHSTLSDPVWEAAKASNLIEVMPQQDIKAYSEIDKLIDHRHQISASNLTIVARTSFESQFQVSSQSPEVDLSSATHADLVEELKLLTAEQSFFIGEHRYDLYIDGALRAVLAGERDLDRIDDAEMDAANAH
jgi:hypothetical protein